MKACILLLCVATLASCQQKRSGDPRVLVFSKSDKDTLNTNAEGSAALLHWAKEHKMKVDTSTNVTLFNEDSLKNYSAVVFLNTSGNILNKFQEVAFERYIQAGGGVLALESIQNTEVDWKWYHRLFTDKDGQAVSQQEVDGGRATSIQLEDQYSNAVFTDKSYLTNVANSLKYAIGKNLELDYTKAKSKPVPAEEDFTKVAMAYGELFEPTEMAILPDLTILIAQRRGELLLLDQKTNKLEQVGMLDVYHDTGIPKVSAEEGFMGLTLDPDFAKNNYIYAFYSPKDTSVNRLSRFEFKNKKLDLKSEKVILQFYSQRYICCHTGGSLAFGKDNLLYLSTGDNSTPFNEEGQKFVSDGYSPKDSRVGHEQYDVQRTSGNTNDLRGKILRIKMNADGTYAIPEGNLFKKDQANTRPEIYVMGNRNPYRISIDQKTGFLYWGEVGPDASKDSLGRGPRGYDEINQARSAGFFGWPYFIGNNYAYHAHNYETGEKGAAFDPKKPINDSRNNTGLRELPAAQAAFIWYPYADSPEFPQVGNGGRNAEAGPVYYSSMFPQETRYPDYYDGKLFIYDWIRGWVMLVSMQPNGDFDKMEPFISNLKLAAPIDMEVGPDGKIYVLEYGSGWFSKNPDAAVARFDYVAGSGKAGKASGAQAGHAANTIGHQQAAIPRGQSLIEASDCKSCHAIDKKSVGPSYQEVAKHYKDNKDAESILVKKIMTGGSGVWGKVAMAAHPNLKKEDVQEMVAWILKQ